MKTGFSLFMLLVSVTFLTALSETEECGLSVEKCFNQVKNSVNAFEDCLFQAKKCDATNALLLETPAATSNQGNLQPGNVVYFQEARKGILFTVSMSKEAKALLKKNPGYVKLIQADSVEFAVAKKGGKPQVIKASRFDVEKLIFTSTFKPQNLEEGKYELTASLTLFKAETKKREKVEVSKAFAFILKSEEDKIVFDSTNNEFFLSVKGIESFDVKPIEVSGAMALNLETADGRKCVSGKKTLEGVKLTYDSLCSVCGKNFEYIITGKESKSGQVEIKCVADELLFSIGKELRGISSDGYNDLRRYAASKASEEKTIRYVEADDVYSARSFGFKQFSETEIQVKNSLEEFLFSVDCDKPRVEIPLGLEGFELIAEAICDDNLEEFNVMVTKKSGKPSSIASGQINGETSLSGKKFDASFSVSNLKGKVKEFKLIGGVGKKVEFRLSEVKANEDQRRRAVNQANAVKLKEIANKLLDKTKAKKLVIVGSEENFPRFNTQEIEVRNGFFDGTKFSSKPIGKDDCFASKFKDCREDAVKVSRIQLES